MTLDELLSDGGPLAKTILGFSARPEQHQYAQAVIDALDSGQSLIIEAGTGTGKTFAYLIPAILSGKKVIVSTGTKTLQEQLYFKDLPLLTEALKKNYQLSLLKGRANYICLNRLNQEVCDETFFTSKQQAQEFSLIKEMLPRLTYGDINEVSMVAEDSSIWAEVTSTTDNCLGRDCTFYDSCYLNKARKRALEAELVVINHHLFFADSLLKEEGFAEILPQADMVIFDEAHQLVDVGTNFFGKRLSSRQLSILRHDIKTEMANLANDDRALLDILDDIEEEMEEFLEAVSTKNTRLPWHEVKNNAVVFNRLEKIHERCFNLHQHLAKVRVRSKVFDKAYERMTAHLSLLHDLLNQQHGFAYWLEFFKKSFSINKTPLVIDKDFQSILNPKTCYIYTSATLSIAKRMDYFTKRLGISELRTTMIDSPFDYYQQTLFYMPRAMPNPRDKAFTERLVANILPIVKRINGRTFLLFTSFSALHLAADILKEEASFSVLVQGERPKLELIKTFETSDNALLLGTLSFWEGVDVKGPKLSCVIIDKLPFESPGCPILQARLQAVKKAGGSPFFDDQLPHAVLLLKQGLGRLIRDKSDKGILIVCDPRLAEKAYGEVFFQSLSLVKKTRDRQNVLEFAEKELTVWSEA